MNQHEAMTWGLRASFVRYVRSAGGSVEAIEPAVLTADDRFAFPVGARQDDLCRYEGGLRITAYGGLIDIELRDPWIHFDDETVLMSALVKNAVGGRVNVARLEVDASDHSATSTLDPQSAVIFDFRYAAGEPLDDIHFGVLTTARTNAPSPTL
jgi:hypothetical protein